MEEGIADHVWSIEEIVGIAMKTVLIALVINLAVASLSSAQTSVGASCKPVFAPADYSRGVPWMFVDQGLASIPLVYPNHGPLLVQRRDAQLGAVSFSLLVYKEDADKSEVTIEGMVREGPADDLKAWSFAARCSSEGLAEGLVTTLEQIAKLARSH
jgi:hypothetical protein